MTAYIIRRLLIALITVIIVTIIVFLAVRLLPGDPLTIFIGQQAASGIITNEQIEVLRVQYRLDKSLPERWRTFSPEVSMAFPRLSVGLAAFAPGPPMRVERLELPGGKRWWRYHLLVARFPVAGGAGELVLANVHLSAFDPAAGLRRTQLEAVTTFLEAEARRGSYVVLGGDWNMLLTETRFPHTTPERYLFWIHPLPSGFPPPGWRLAADDRVASVRTLERPYVRGGNYTAVIDGFLVSPNVTVLEVRTEELGFRFSDHQPVTVRLRLD